MRKRFVVHFALVKSQRQYAANVVQGRRQMFPSFEFAADHYWKKR
jgi:hypothetical protein